MTERDIVERLRASSPSDSYDCSLMDEAACEIERLRERSEWLLSMVNVGDRSRAEKAEAALRRIVYAWDHGDPGVVERAIDAAKEGLDG